MKTPIPEQLHSFEPHPINGLKLATICAGMYPENRQDMVLMVADQGSHCAATFTRNALCAAPVKVARDHMARDTPRAWLINAGYANAATGQQGLELAHESCRVVAAALQCRVSEVIPFSTGVIGGLPPRQKLLGAIPELVSQLHSDNWVSAAHAIMTTDTRIKTVHREIVLSNQTVHLNGIAKGAGMIRPNMATMLAFIATDARIEPSAMRSWLSSAVARSFNTITVDGQTSTNDACAFIATGKAHPSTLTNDHSDGLVFARALHEVCLELAEQIMGDAEGATRLMDVRIEHARDDIEARLVAYSIAESALVKTALHAGDPNWGRLWSAIGQVLPEPVCEQTISLWLNDQPLLVHGALAESYREEQATAAMKEKKITFRVDLGRGHGYGHILGCDLSHEYIRINCDYRS